MNLQSDRVMALCEELKLTGVSESFASLATKAVETEQSFVDFLEDALIAERDSRRARSAATLVRMAGFPVIKTLDDYDFKFATTAPMTTHTNSGDNRSCMAAPAANAALPIRKSTISSPSGRPRVSHRKRTPQTVPSPKPTTIPSAGTTPTPPKPPGRASE